MKKNNTTFSARQQDVADHLLQGFTPKEISYRLNISTRTTEKHLNQLKVKTHSRTIIHLIYNLHKLPVMLK